MNNINKWEIITFVLAIIGVTFSMMFQGMAYWGPGGSLTWIGFWVGAILSYSFS